jgi:hypothetical protein
MGLSVGSDGADGESGETMEGGFGQVGVRGGSGRGVRVASSGDAGSGRWVGGSG